MIDIVPGVVAEQNQRGYEPSTSKVQFFAMKWSPGPLQSTNTRPSQNVRDRLPLRKMKAMLPIVPPSFPVDLHQFWRRSGPRVLQG
jgi:hypothetical protein